jgi:hypothetical protein
MGVKFSPFSISGNLLLRTFLLPLPATDAGAGTLAIARDLVNGEATTLGIGTEREKRYFGCRFTESIGGHVFNKIAKHGHFEGFSEAGGDALTTFGLVIGS